MRPSSLLFIPFLGLLVLALTGCGASGGGGDAATGSSTTPTPAAPTTGLVFWGNSYDHTASAGTMQAKMASGKVQVYNTAGILGLPARFRLETWNLASPTSATEDVGPVTIAIIANGTERLRVTSVYTYTETVGVLSRYYQFIDAEFTPAVGETITSVTLRVVGAKAGTIITTKGDGLAPKYGTVASDGTISLDFPNSIPVTPAGAG